MYALKFVPTTQEMCDKAAERGDVCYKFILVKIRIRKCATKQYVKTLAPCNMSLIRL